MCLSVGLSAFLSSSLLLPSFFSSLLLTFRLSFSSACFSLCFTFSYCRSLSSAGRSPLLFSPAGRERARARAQFPFGHQSPPILAWLLARILSGFVGFFWCLRLANFTVETSGLKGILQRRSEEFSRRFERIYRGWMAFGDFSGMLNNCSEILFRFFNVPREFCGDPIKTFWICSFFFCSKYFAGRYLKDCHEMLQRYSGDSGIILGSYSAIVGGLSLSGVLQQLSRRREVDLIIIRSCWWIIEAVANGIKPTELKECVINRTRWNGAKKSTSNRKLGPVAYDVDDAGEANGALAPSSLFNLPAGMKLNNVDLPDGNRIIIE